MQGGGGVSCAVAGEAPSAAGLHRVGGGRLGLTIDPAGDVEAPAERIGRLVRESPVVIFARRGCCMCHVMRRLLAAVGAHATVIELEEAAEEAAASAARPWAASTGSWGSTSAAASSHASGRSARSAASYLVGHARTSPAGAARGYL